MRLNVEHLGDVVVVMPEGSLGGDREKKAFQKALRHLVEERQGKVIIDLAKVSHLSAIDMGIMMGAWAKAEHEGLHFCVCCMPARMEDAIRSVVCFPRIAVYRTRDDALKALARL